LGAAAAREGQHHGRYESEQRQNGTKSTHRQPRLHLIDMIVTDDGREA